MTDKAMLAAAPEPATPAPTSVQDGQTTPLEVAAPLPDECPAPSCDECHERGDCTAEELSRNAGAATLPAEIVTNDPEVSREHLLEIAKKCGLIGGYTTREIVDAVTGYAQVVLRDKAVQEAFVRANPSSVSVAPLPDDVAKLVERLRTGGESYEELLDLCTRQAADMLERLARELAAVKAENEKLRENDARYRWLRDHTTDKNSLVITDAAIDAAMKGEK